MYWLIAFNYNLYTNRPLNDNEKKILDGVLKDYKNQLFLGDKYYE